MSGKSVSTGLLSCCILFALFGCASAGSAPATNTSSKAGSSIAASPTKTATPNEEALTEPLILDIIERSYLRFEAEGMTERVESDGESFVLLFDPKQPDYQAAWFNLDTGERELIFETDYFTLFVAYLMVDVPGYEVEILEEGFVLSAPEWTPIEYQVMDDYLVGAKGVDQEWVAEFEYLVDPEFLPGLEELAAELIASFEE